MSLPKTKNEKVSCNSTLSMPTTSHAEPLSPASYSRQNKNHLPTAISTTKLQDEVKVFAIVFLTLVKTIVFFIEQQYSDLYRKSQCAIWGNLWNFIDNKLLFIDVIVRFKLNKNAKVHRSPFTNLSITLFRIKIEFSIPFVVFTLDQATFTFFHTQYNRCIDCKQQTTPKW